MRPEKPDDSAQSEVAKDAKPRGIAPPRRIGFMEGELTVPHDFDEMDAEEIRALFEDEPLFPDEPPRRP